MLQPSIPRTVLLGFVVELGGLVEEQVAVVAQVMLEDKNITRELLLNAGAIGVVSGIALELANFFFLAKRREMSRLSGEIAAAQKEINSIQQKIRESLRR